MDERLSAVFGWFEAAPLPVHLANLVEELEDASPVALQEQRAYVRR